MMWKISIKTLQEFQDNGGGGGGLPCNTSIDRTYNLGLSFLMVE